MFHRNCLSYRLLRWKMNLWEQGWRIGFTFSFVSAIYNTGRKRYRKNGMRTEACRHWDGESMWWKMWWKIMFHRISLSVSKMEAGEGVKANSELLNLSELRRLQSTRLQDRNALPDKVPFWPGLLQTPCLPVNLLLANCNWSYILIGVICKVHVSPAWRGTWRTQTSTLAG